MSDLGWRYLTPSDKEAMLRGVRDGVAYGGPFHVEIHPADRCNLDCFFCSTASIRGTDELPLQRFEELIGELRAAGTRAIRFSGGGEPLFHRSIKQVLRAIAESGIPIENITTNAVLMDVEIAKLLTRCCDEVTVSLNTGDAETYATMMKTPARNFDRVLKNVRTLVATRDADGARRPKVTLQFLVWRDNFRSIPEMYRLARELRVDNVFFNGLAFLTPDQKMSEEEHAEMMRLYEEVARLDEFRTIRHINSFERDITAEVEAMIGRLSRERAAQPFVKKLTRFLGRSDFTMREKLAHHWSIRRKVRASQAAKTLDDSCVIGWYSMLVRSDGTVGPCCILQGKKLGNVFRQSVDEVWKSPEYQRFRGELTNIIREREQWSPAGDEQTVESVCALKGADLCPMKTFYFAQDTPFVDRLGGVFTSFAK